MSKYNKVMMKTAHLWAEMSYCNRLKVGAVLAQDNRIVSTGYNGTVHGHENICECYRYICPDCNMNITQDVKDEKDQCKCGKTIGRWDYYAGGRSYSSYLSKTMLDKTNEFTVHAEQNVITYAAKNGISTDDCTLYITHSPCKNCSKLIVQSGITRVVYLNEYKDASGIDFLKACNVSVQRLKKLDL
jgi:dCMP deaminase